LLTRTYLLPLLMQASVQSLSEVRSAWAARIFVWLTPHALSEIFPVHIAPKQDVASKAVAKVILEIIWNTPGKLDRHKWKVCPSKRKNAEGWATHHPHAAARDQAQRSVGKLQSSRDGGGKSPIARRST